MSDAEALQELLEERPEIESALKALLRVDEDQESWSFDDVPLDSGIFGELVSEGVVESVDNQYRLSDPATVRTVLDPEDGQSQMETGEDQRSLEWSWPELPAVSRIEGVLLGCSLLVVVAFRALPFGDVFRKGEVVLSGNDPYYYRYWVELLLTRASSPFDLSALSTLPDSVLHGEPLLVVVLWVVSEVLGGTPQTAGFVLAWYPVVAAVVGAVALYAFSRTVTDDKRVALAAVVFLAITPTHALRTSVGYADHHAFDFVWVALTALALVKIVEHRDTGRRAMVWTAVLVAGIIGQSLAWNAGVLLVVPVGLFVFGDSLLAARRDGSTLHRFGPLIAGVGLGAGVVSVVHLGFGWQQPEGVAGLWILFVGCLTVVTVAEAGRRSDWSTPVIAGVDAAIGVVALVVFWFAAPGVRSALITGLTRLTTDSDIAEVQPLLSFNSFGFVLLFGFGLLLAVPVLAWTLVYAREGHPKWLVVSSYAGWYLSLSLFQVRFTGELAFFVALLDGVAFLWLAGAVGLVTRSTPFGSATVTQLSVPPRKVLRGLVLLFALVAVLGVVQTPVKIDQVQADNGEFQSAAWMDEYATEQGLSYPDNYVFSQWGQNRMFNYFVSGNARSYAFAQQYYSEFATSQRPDRWYDRLRGRAGFVVTEDGTADSVAPDSVLATLHNEFGGDDRPGFGHYRVRYIDSDGSRKVFTLVRGAKLVGHGSPETTYTVSTNRTVSGQPVTYTREVTTGPGGVYNVTVPYPGEYTTTNRSVQVSNAAVESGNRVVNLGSDGLAHWTFAEGAGNVTYDYARGRRLFDTAGRWTDGVQGSALAFEPGEQGVVVDDQPYGVGSNESLTASFYIRGNLSTNTDQRQTVVRYRAGGGTYYDIGARGRWNDFGITVWGDEGRARNYGVGSTTFESWTHVAVVVDRSSDELRLYRNGSLVSIAATDGIGEIYDGGRLVVGPRSANDGVGPVALDEIRVFQEALSTERIQSLANESG